MQVGRRRPGGGVHDTVSSSVSAAGGARVFWRGSGSCALPTPRYTFHLAPPAGRPPLGSRPRRLGALADVGTSTAWLPYWCRRGSATVGDRRGRPVHFERGRCVLGGMAGLRRRVLASVECSFEAPERQLLEFVGTDAAVSVERAFTPGPNDTGFDLRHLDGSITRVETGGADPYLKMIGISRPWYGAQPVPLAPQVTL